MSSLFSRWGEGRLGRPKALPTVLVEPHYSACLTGPELFTPFTPKAMVPQLTRQQLGEGESVMGLFSSLVQPRELPAVPEPGSPSSLDLVRGLSHL